MKGSFMYITNNFVHGAAQEVHRQGAGPLSVSDLCSAWVWLTSTANGKITRNDLLSVAACIVGANDTFLRYRTTPVYFAGGGSAASHDVLEDAMDRWLVEFNELLDKPGMNLGLTDQIIKQFLYLHPFEDGNGRMAWLLRNFALEIGHNPLPLPSYYFS
jgi:hypothetical protein